MTQKTDAKSQGGVKITLWLGAGLMLIVAAVLLVQQPSQATGTVVVYKSPTCGCCSAWVKHMEQNGFNVEVYDRQNMNPVKTEFGVPAHLQSCHTAKVGDYVIEGHVPADLVAKLLEDKPPVKGLTVPGMPMGSPGMEGPHKDDYAVLTFQADGNTQVYAQR